MDVKSELQRLENEIKEIRKRQAWIRKRRKILAKLPEGSLCGGMLDFDNLPHSEILKVVKGLGGKWTKTKNFHEEGKVDYQQKIDGVDVRCWKGQPPPSCRLVEVEEVIPEQIIPAHVVEEQRIPEKRIKKFKMICTGVSDPLAVAIARVQSPITETQNQTAANTQ